MKKSKTTQPLNEKVEIERLISTFTQKREETDVSQRDLADATGIKQSAIARLESEKNNTTLNTMLRLLIPLGYTLEVVSVKK